MLLGLLFVINCNFTWICLASATNKGEECENISVYTMLSTAPVEEDGLISLSLKGSSQQASAAKGQTVFYVSPTICSIVATKLGHCTKKYPHVNKCG